MGLCRANTQNADFQYKSKSIIHRRQKPRQVISDDGDSVPTGHKHPVNQFIVSILLTFFRYWFIRFHFWSDRPFFVVSYTIKK